MSQPETTFINEKGEVVCKVCGLNLSIEGSVYSSKDPNFTGLCIVHRNGRCTLFGVESIEESLEHKHILRCAKCDEEIALLIPREGD